jgi:uncharacterized protein (DUF1697 family)
VSQYAGFLRGINVGGKTLKMDALREALEAGGFENVSTVLASGNVVFENKEIDQAKLRSGIEKIIKDTFGLNVHVIVRNVTELQKLIKSEPFKGIKVTPKTRLYVTFLSQAPKSKLKLPHKSLNGDYIMLQVSKGEAIGVLTLTPHSGTVDAMAVLEKEFGKDITTRNWNTILKVHSLLGK